MTAAPNVDLSAPCDHLDQATIRHVRRPAAGCVDCLKMGGQWVHLRECLTCGHIGCCDSSPAQHATAHWKATGHPVIQSFEPGEDWFWDYSTDQAGNVSQSYDVPFTLDTQSPLVTVTFSL